MLDTGRYNEPCKSVRSMYETLLSLIVHEVQFIFIQKNNVVMGCQWYIAINKLNLWLTTPMGTTPVNLTSATDW